MSDKEQTRQRRHQLKRREQGMCAVEGCPVYTGRGYYCLKHKATRREARRAALRAKREARLAAISRG